MAQLVYRENGKPVDDALLEILATKAVLFDEYVRRSELKDHSPDAVDVSDLQAVGEVGSQVEAERRIIELERKRLRPPRHNMPVAGTVRGSLPACPAHAPS